MSRRRRFRFAGLSYHIVQRGNNRMDIFQDEQDFEILVTMLRDAATRHAMDINAYALMRNHFHLLVTPQRPESLEKAMHLASFQYARYYNDRYGRTGSLFEGRYRTTVIDTDRYWYACMRYVELNPVRAGVVSRPDAYYWTSYAAHALGRADRLLTPHPLYLALGAAAADRARNWRGMCTAGLADDELDAIRSVVHGGGVLGTLRIPDEGDRPTEI